MCFLDANRTPLRLKTLYIMLAERMDIAAAPPTKAHE
jgi:hypothetical protein